jgi:hypothetical protein
MLDSWHKCVEHAMLSLHDAQGWLEDAMSKHYDGDLGTQIVDACEYVKTALRIVKYVDKAAAEQEEADALVSDPNEGSEGPEVSGGHHSGCKPGCAIDHHKYDYLKDE